MIYNSIERIPHKIYLEVESTSNLELLTDEDNIPIEKLIQAWNQIKKEHSELPEDAEERKVLNLARTLQELCAKLECIELSVHHLESLYDQELVDQLRSYNYQLRDGDEFESDLSRIKRESEGLFIRTEAMKEKLPKQDDNKEQVTLDETVLAYCSITSLGFINPNEITTTQFYALIKTGNQKMKSLENGQG